MKTSAGIALGAILLVGASVSSVQADPTPSRSPAKTVSQDEPERYVYVTGSHIRQKIALKSIGTTTPYNLRIYTKDELDTTGRQTLAGALSIDPSIRISGGR